MKIIKTKLNYLNQETNALIFLPEIGVDDISEVKSTFAVFTHGYTADKSSIINWPIRLAEAGVSSILFDLPGHYLGTFSEVLAWSVSTTFTANILLYHLWVTKDEKKEIESDIIDE